MSDRATRLSANLLNTLDSEINPATEEGQEDIVTAINNIGTGGPDNFSYNVIEENVIIPLYQQMGVWGELIVPTGQLDIIGQVILTT